MSLKNAAASPMTRLLTAAVFLYIMAGAGLAAPEGAVLSGDIRDGAGAPLTGARLILRPAELGRDLEAVSDPKGNFDIVGIPPGRYSLLVEAGGDIVQESSDLVFEPGAVWLLSLRLPAAGGAAGAHLRLVDLSPPTGRTIIAPLQLESLPAGDNVWSLIENQDLSATANRIDIGGVWADVPALWSSRGGVTWTQSAYRLNGLDVTDPWGSGTALFHPDLNSLAYTSHADGRQSIADLSPGGVFSLQPRQGTADWHGAAELSLTPSGLATDHVPDRLVEENLTERTHLNSLSRASGRISGPLVPGRLLLFASVGRLDVSRDVAEFAADDKGEVSSGMINLTCLLPRGSLRFLWTGQNVRRPTSGAGREVPLESTLGTKSAFNVAQLLWDTRFGPGHVLEFGASFAGGRLRSDFREEATAPHGEEVFTKVPSGAADSAGLDRRTSWSLIGRGTAAFRTPGGWRHQLEYGTSLRYASSLSDLDILDGLHLRYWEDAPFEVVRFNAPATQRARALDLHLFARDRIVFPNRATLEFGVHAVRTRGWVPAVVPGGAAAPGFPAVPEAGGEVRWTNLSPRLAVSLPLSRGGSARLGVSAARYYFELPLSYLSYGNPGAPGGLAYSWTDPDGDGRFEDVEQGPLVRREGPYFATLDPGLKRPRTDEYSISLSKAFGGGFRLGLAGYYRETRDLVETLNVGVPLDSAYDAWPLYDPGDNRIPGDHDDLNFTIYDQKPETLGRDAFLLTNPGGTGRVSRYRGLDLTVVKKFSPRTVFFFSGTATEAVGTTGPGNTERENDDGVIGALYDNPNAAVEARGRLRFDRAYTARLGLSVPAPGGFRLSALVKYYDGQPFIRKLIVSGFNQGPFYIQTDFRGKARYEFNMTVDLRLEKRLALGSALARLFLEGYNIFDWANATAEGEWTGPEFLLRYATEVQSPRVFRIGLAYEF